MTLRCDHCRGELGLLTRRYWRMRFCSEACKQAYQRRLGESTRDKIGRLDRGARNGHLAGPHSSAGFGRPFAA
jgi:hypothetical protein